MNGGNGAPGAIPAAEQAPRNRLPGNSTTSRRESVLLGAVAALWIVAFYFVRNPYRGVRHDAVLYFGQLQHHLTPDRLKNDLFFLFDVQDRYSVFSTLFAPLLQVLGLSSAEIVILLALHALFLFAAWQLTAGMPATTRWSALALALVLPHFYAARQRFAFMEPFLTARSLAEPFAVLALAWLLRGRRGLALAAAVFATLSHPLIALPVWLVGWRLLCAEDKRWNWAVLLALPVVLLAWLGVAPLDGLMHRFDAQWLANTKLANSFVFITSWAASDWQQIVFDAGLLWLCARNQALPMGRLARATLVATIALLLLSVVGADLLHGVLVTQLQLWRVTWIAHLVALLSLGPLSVELWRRGGKGQLAVFAVLLGAIAVGAVVHTAWVAILVTFGAVALAESRVVVGAAVLRLGITACLLAALLVSGIVAVSQLQQLSMGADSGISIGRASALWSTLPALVLAIGLVGQFPVARPGRLATAVSAIAAAALLAVGASQWDQRTDWSRYVEQAREPLPFQALIPVDATVYWTDGLLATWALLGRSAFYDPAQMSGTVFNRQTSVTGMAHRVAVDPLVVQSKLCRELVATGLTTTTLADCKPTLVAVRDVCHLNSVHPDFIVLNSPIELPPLAAWKHFSEDGSEPADHFLYACNKIP